MKKYSAYPTRFVALPREQDPAEVGLLIRSATGAPGEDAPQVKWRVRNTLKRRIEQRSRVLRFALVGTFLFVAGGVVGAAVQPLWRARATKPGPASADTAAGPHAAYGPRRRAQMQAPAVVQTAGEPPDGLVAAPAAAAGATAAPPAPALPLADPAKPGVGASNPAGRHLAAPSPSTRVRPEPGLSSQPAAPVMPAPVVPAPVLPASAPAVPPPVGVASAVEQGLIATALEKLRTSHEPEAALAALDEYARRFPGGVLAPEAARLRTEAFLLLGRKAAVLDELDRFAGATPGDERLLLRGELRAAAGRWQAALADFNAAVRALAASSAGPDEDDQRSGERLERALWGRASARSRLGDDAGARADLREYLRRFPEGRFAVQANRLLEERR